MNVRRNALASGLLLLWSVAQAGSPSAPIDGPTYAADGGLMLPANYREWVFLSAGIDMSYIAGAMPTDPHMMDNVFVDPAAYRAFQATGRWPDRTMLVKENRRASGKGSINKSGNFQSTEIMDIEVHLKDASRFPAKWAFFDFGAGRQSAAAIPQAADCYSCHAAHGAVDNTFVQFYPTLLLIAKAKGTLSAGYKRDEGAPD